MPRTLRNLGICALLLSLSGCASTPDYTARVERFLFPTLKIRRPEGASADPKVGPGGRDYRSEPLPNERWDCDAPGALFHEVDLETLRSCWSQSQREVSDSKEAIQVTYRLRSEAKPFLELLDPEEAPPCLAQSLPRLPVPREIFFQSIERGDLECFSSRLDLEKNRYLGIGIPLSRWDLQVTWPPESVPKSTDELRKILLGWSLRPFWTDEERLKVLYVPEHFCRKCLEDAWLKEVGPDVTSEIWPP